MLNGIVLSSLIYFISCYFLGCKLKIHKDHLDKREEVVAPCKGKKLGGKLADP